MAREDPDATIAKAHNVFIRLALPPYTIHFKSDSYLHPTTLDLLDKKVSKETLKATSSTTDVSSSNAVREAIGTDARFWEEWVEVLRAAVPSLERRSFDMSHDGSSVDYESARGALIASNYPRLWRDLERLNDIVSIGRNVLTVGNVAQDLAAEHGVESEIFRLVHVCVRVTARGYDSEAGTQEEEKWQWVVNAYKKVLITSLQFLNNLVAQNEERKMRLWVNLFDTPPQQENGDAEQKLLQRKPPPPPPPEPEPLTQPVPPFSTKDILLAYGATGPSQRVSPLEMQAAQPLYADEGFNPIPKEAQKEVDRKTYKPNAWVYFVAKYRATCIKQFHEVHKRSPMLAEIHKNLPHYWHKFNVSEIQKHAKNGTSGMWSLWTQHFQTDMENYRLELEAWNEQQNRPPSLPKEPPRLQPPPPKPAPPPISFEVLEKDLTVKMKESGPTTAPAGYDFAAFQDLEFNPLKPRDEDEEKDLKMVFTAEAGKKILEQGKGELMRRLEGESSSSGRRHSISGEASSPLGGTEAADSSMANMMFDENQKGRAEEARRAGRRRSEPSLLRGPIHTQQHAEDTLEDEEVDDSDDSGSESSSDESYPGSSEDGRGLLTDVPLILGPSEIEVLPMLIMSGIVQTVPSPDKRWLTEWEIYLPPPDAPWEEQKEGQAKMREWHTLRTNLLLSQTSGRNLLRELLIFVAAWDLREEELYFKFMLKITESILRNGLMPYAYHAFRDRSKSKDIISPAQAVLIKLLTSIFRTRNTAFLRTLREHHDTEGERKVHHPDYGPMPYTLYLARMKWCPNRADLQLMTFLFSEFRQHIIPQTCALIFLQGQVRRGRAGSEDFPLNLWDMERMYEGVYQVLEFFAGIVEEIPANSAPKPPAQGLYGGPAHPLSGYWQSEQINGIKEHNKQFKTDEYPSEEAKQMEKEQKMGEWFSWKKVLAGWEMVSELVTLLRELEEGILKINTPQPPPPQQTQQSSKPPGQLASNQQRSISAGAVTRTNHTTPSQTPIAVERPFDLDPPASGSQYPSPDTPVGDAEHPLAYPPSDPAAPLSSHDQDEPADFEWRNLKKLTVLVLSSLVWKNSQVQDQLRQYGGLEVLLRCCREDDNNPYIREHAIMCLRFAIEGNQANWDAVKAIADAGGKGEFASFKYNSMTGVQNPPVVPKEVLDEGVYERLLEDGTKVHLRRKEGGGLTGNTSVSFGCNPSTVPSTASPLAPAAASGVKKNAQKPPKLSDTEMTAEKAAELMQNALRNLPLSDKLVTDRQKADALARLDKAFEGAEKALGGD